jgi:dienelactone hydrolase
MSSSVHPSRRAVLAAASLVGVAPRRIAGAWANTPQSQVQLIVSPNPVAYDAPMSVRVTGLKAGQMVTITAEVADDARLQWTASGTFVADDQGAVDLSRQSPQEGAWATPDPMGLIWSLEPSGTPMSTWDYSSTLAPPPLTITVRSDNLVLAQVDLVRQLETSEIADANVSDHGLWGRLFSPVGSGPFPGVLVLGGSEGGISPVIVREAALLARHGFAALALAYFGYASLPVRLEHIPLEYFGDAIAWLGAQSGVRSDQFGVVGHSRGGELALLLGTIYPQLTAVVSYSGSGLSMPSPNDVAKPAWTWKGKPIPSFYDPSDWNDAAIPVERIAGPVLLISGEADTLWPSSLLSQVALDRLVAQGHDFSDAHYSYPEAGHLIQAPYVPTGLDLEQYGGTAAGLAAANADAWPRVLQLLNDQLKSTSMGSNIVNG